MRSFLRTLFNKSPIRYTQGLGFGLSGLAGTTTNIEGLLRTYGSVGTLFAIVNRLANSTASINWHLYRAVRDGDPVEVLAHPAKDLWDRPNPFMTNSDFVETFMQHLDLVGEAWWLLARSNAGFGPPLEIWPIRPDKMAPVPHPTEFISGYLYRGGAEPVPFRLDEVIFLKTPSPLDPYRGMGPVQAILTDIDAERFSAAWNRNFFMNSAEPGGIVQVDKRLTDDEFNEMCLRWKEQHQGIENAHRVAILEQATWVDRKYTQRDMQFALLRETNREIIREAFAFPKPLLGTTTDVNRANAEAAEIVFARWCIRPRLERIKQALNEKLLPLFGSSGKGLYFDYEDPTPEDKAQAVTEMSAKVEAVAALVRAGFDPIESLAVLGLPEISHTGALPVTVQPISRPSQQASGPPNPRGRYPNMVNKEKDPVAASERQIEASWADRLDAERIALEEHLDQSE